MTPTPIRQVLSTFQKSGVRNLLMGGQACVFYGAAQVSKDINFLVLPEPENFARLRAALAELQAEGNGVRLLTAVESGAELGSSGVIGGAMSILAGGTLSPGNSIQSLAAGATTFAAGSTLEYEVDSTDPLSLAAAADLLVVTSNLTIQSGALLSFLDLATTPQPFVDNTTIFAPINYSGSWDGGLFTYGGNLLADGSQFTVGSQLWEIDYNRTSAAGLDNFTDDYLPASSFVSITAVPEPATWALGIAGIAAALVIRRRK